MLLLSIEIKNQLAEYRDIEYSSFLPERSITLKRVNHPRDGYYPRNALITQRANQSAGHCTVTPSQSSSVSFLLPTSGWIILA